MAFPKVLPQPDLTDGSQSGAPDDDAARLDDLEARVSAIEAKLGLAAPDQSSPLDSAIGQSNPFGK